MSNKSMAGAAALTGAAAALGAGADDPLSKEGALRL